MRKIIIASSALILSVAGVVSTHANTIRKAAIAVSARTAAGSCIATQATCSLSGVVICTVVTAGGTNSTAFRPGTNCSVSLFRPATH